MSSETVMRIEEIFGQLLGLQVFKAWNIFATRIFYFAAPGFENVNVDGDYRLTLECPWRIEQDDRILVGSEDYGLRASGNLDPTWNPSEMQWGHLQDQKLAECFGEYRNGIIVNTTGNLVVDSVGADVFGGFRLSLTGGYTLCTFPTTTSAMEWLLSRREGGNFSMTNGMLSEPTNGLRRVEQ